MRLKTHASALGASGSFALALVLALPAASSASAATHRVLHSFCQVALCADGYAPSAGLVRDADGNLYGTTAGGGANGAGEVFELLRDGSSWDFKIIYSFCAQADCADGGFPAARLIMDTSGNLYGTNNGLIGGSVFELVPNADRSKWSLTTLHAFCVTQNCTDGLVPLALSYRGQQSGSFYDGVSALFGTTQLGGTGLGGTVYTLKPPVHGKTAWKEKILYNFCSQANCADGNRPSSGVTLDARGNLYGTTAAGGATGTSGESEGILYELSSGSWNETILYSFCQQAECKDGETPNGTLVLDANGSLWGEAGGGKVTHNQYGGVVYSWNILENVVHTFCDAKGCSDGQSPAGGLSIDADGDVFGVTDGGPAAKGNGSVFEFAGGTAFATLQAFCGNGHKCKAGEFPNGDLIADGSGNLFGTTGSGGENSHGHTGGTIFELTP